jgi:tRNA 2-selenouridine synthase
LQQGEWAQLVRELMIRYYDPLYLHTLPEQRREVQFSSFDEGMQQLREAIVAVLDEQPLG